MTDQPEALLQRLERLGQDGVGNYGMPICAEAAVELRRLHHENERLKAEVLMERAACADICDQHASVEGIAQRCAEQIRARSTT